MHVIKWVGLNLGLIVASTALAQNGVPELEIISAAHRQHVEGFRSIQVAMIVDVSIEGKKAGSYQAEWFQKGHSIRWKQNIEGMSQDFDDPSKPVPVRRKVDVLLVGVDGTVVDNSWNGRTGDQKEGRIGLMRPSDATGYSTVWASAGLMVYSKPEIWVKDILASKDWDLTTRTIMEDGVRLIQLEGIAKKAGLPAFQLWIDPHHGHLANRGIIFESGKIDRSQNYSEFRVSAFLTDGQSPVQWFPGEVRWDFHLISKETGAVERISNLVRFSKLQVNQDLPSGIFKLAIPPGYKVVNRASGQVYTVDQNGMPGPKAKLIAIPTIQQVTSESDGRRPWFWIISGSILVIMGLLLVRYLRRSFAN